LKTRRRSLKKSPELLEMASPEAEGVPKGENHDYRWTGKLELIQFSDLGKVSCVNTATNGCKKRDFYSYAGEPKRLLLPSEGGCKVEANSGTTSERGMT